MLEKLLQQTRDPKKVIAGIEWQIAVAVAADKVTPPSPSSALIMENHRIYVPDTPGLTELPEGKALIRRLLLSPDFGMTWRPTDGAFTNPAKSGGNVERLPAASHGKISPACRIRPASGIWSPI